MDEIITKCLATHFIPSHAFAVPPPFGSMSLHSGITSKACSGLSTATKIRHIPKFQVPLTEMHKEIAIVMPNELA